MRYALVENGIVVHVVRVNPFTIIHEHIACLYIEAPEDVDVMWRFDGAEWLPPYVDYAKARSRKVVDIKVERDMRKNGGVEVAGKWFHTDSDSRIQQLGLVMMGAAVPAVQWKTMDGTFVTMTQVLAQAIFNAVASLDIDLFTCAETNIATVAALPDAEVVGYVTTGWPDHYQL